MGERILVVGGTGPTGVPLVRGLVARGHEVTILHQGCARVRRDAAGGAAPACRPVRRGGGPARPRPVLHSTP
ncbi:hypothetical protein ACU686_04355 [Yinghuangia aomiensis]